MYLPSRALQDSEPASLPSSPRVARRSIFSSEPKTRSVSALTRMSSRDSLRSPARRREKPSTPPTPRRAWTKEKVSGEEVVEYEEVGKLPLPELSDTLAQYLDNIRPLVTDTIYNEAKSIIDKFSAKDGVGEKVMMVLEERQAKTDNWAYDYWLNDMYLNQRLPLPVNFNPAMVLPRRKFNNNSQMLSYTARLVHGFVVLKARLDQRLVPQDRARSDPLCMAQYYRVMTSYRQPGREQDRQISSGTESKEREVVVVGRRGHWYSLQVKTNKRWASLEEIYSGLMDLWERSEGEAEADQDQRLAYLTSTDRNSWADSFSHLTKQQQNSDNLKVMADSLMLVCLDEETQNSSDGQRSLKEMFRQMMTGGGSRYNGSNRWYDKTVQLVVTRDGVSGICYEHSASEGIVVIQLLENVIKELEARATLPIAYHSDNIEQKKLEWVLDDRIKSSISEAISALDTLDNNVDLEVFNFTSYGKEFIKSCRCSPDSWLQMSLQLTMFRLTAGLVPTYESASTRRFRLGRVDSIRSAHPEALAWCRAMGNERLGKEDRKRYFELAMRKQTKVMADNITGRGLDVPLLGLREGVKEAGLWEYQELFDHQTYSLINHFKLSTSSVPVGLTSSFMGYGAVVPDGYGVSYNPYSDNVIFCVASFFSCPETNSRKLASELQLSLQDMKLLYTK